MKVLVIEDEAVDRKLVGAVLRVHGHTVHDSANAQDALAAIRRDRPDVILLDLRLPGLDGLRLAKLLKSAPCTRHIPIVALTAYPERYPRQALLDAGCQECIVKPFDTRALSRQLEKIAGASLAPKDDRPCES